MQRLAQRRVPLGIVFPWMAAMLIAAEPADREVRFSVHPRGIVNAADFAPAPDNYLAPGSIVAIFGEGLATATVAAGPVETAGGRLPLTLAGVAVRIGGVSVPLYFVSPGQINAQIPFELNPAVETHALRVIRGTTATAAAEVRLRRAAPGLFPVALRADYQLVGADSEAGQVRLAPGDIVLLWGTGFGAMQPFDPAHGTPATGEMWPHPSRLALPLEVLLDGEAVSASDVLYAGNAPGFAGLYQVNVRLPERRFAEDPEVRVRVGGALSAAGLRLAVERAAEPDPMQLFPPARVEGQ